LGNEVEELRRLYRPEVLQAARTNFARFFSISIDQVDDLQMAESSSGIAGWSTANVLDWDRIDGEREERASRNGGNCWAFGDDDDGEDVRAASRHNDQVIRMIDTLGSFSAGRRAVIKALAERQGIEDESQLEDLYSGKSDVKLRVPHALRASLSEIGLGDLLATINILEHASPAEILVSAEGWTDIEFEVALDSGAVVHVCSKRDVPGYHVGESDGSRRGQ
jgi:hypothetical protein